MKHVLLILAGIFLITACSNNTDEPYQAGTHFSVDKTKTQSQSPEVLVFMSFACPACRKFESAMHDYSVQDGVTFEIIPVSFDRPGWSQLVKAYAVLRQLNVHHEFTLPLFKAVQDDRRNVGTKMGFAMWYNEVANEIGVGKEFINQISNIYDSEQTQQLIEKYYVGEKQFRITGVPTVWVNGDTRLIQANLRGESEEEQKAELFGLLDHTISLHKNDNK
jgi:hypothetical protein